MKCFAVCRRPLLKTSHLFAAFLFILLQSCMEDKGKNIPDVSHISVSLNVERFDQALFSLDTNAIASGMNDLNSKYPAFTKLYFENVMGVPVGKLTEAQFQEAVKGLISHPGIRAIYDTCQIVYGNLEAEKAALQEAFQFYKYYFPEQAVPTIYTFISEYTYAAFVADDNILAMGLDFGLGADYPHYNPQFFPRYIRRSMDKDHMPKLVLDALVDDMVGNQNGNRLLDMMIHNGKKLYILAALLPRTPDSIKLSYTPAQVEWCENNEAQRFVVFHRNERHPQAGRLQPQFTGYAARSTRTHSKLDRLANC